MVEFLCINNVYLNQKLSRTEFVAIATAVMGLWCMILIGVM